MADSRLTYPVLLSILAALVTVLLKATAYWFTGSVGLLSDAAESLINLLAASVAYFSVRFSAKPVDTTHTYGHEKIEFFSSGLEGVLIIGAAVAIAVYAIRRLILPEELEQLDLGAAITIAAALVNLVVARILLHAGRKHNSIVLEADGKHLMTDVWTSAGVVFGLLVIWLADKIWSVRIAWVDPIIALALAANITWTGVGLVRRSFDGLMDHALPKEEQDKIRAAIESHIEPGMHFHALRSRKAGSTRFIDFHLLVPGDMSVSATHSLIQRIEQAIHRAFEDCEITIHAEPVEERASWEDSELLPVEEAARERRDAEG
jgi:cation diffusion facilitator family transporter